MRLWRQLVPFPLICIEIDPIHRISLYIAWLAHNVAVLVVSIESDTLSTVVVISVPIPSRISGPVIGHCIGTMYGRKLSHVSFGATEWDRRLGAG